MIIVQRGREEGRRARVVAAVHKEGDEGGGAAVDEAHDVRHHLAPERLHRLLPRRHHIVKPPFRHGVAYCAVEPRQHRQPEVHHAGYERAHHYRAQKLYNVINLWNIPAGDRPLHRLRPGARDSARFHCSASTTSS